MPRWKCWATPHHYECQLVHIHTHTPQVVQAALEVLRDSMRLCSHAYDSSLDRVLPCVFGKLLDQKDPVRVLAGEVVQGVCVFV